MGGTRRAGGDWHRQARLPLPMPAAPNRSLGCIRHTAHYIAAMAGLVVITLSFWFPGAANRRELRTVIEQIAQPK